MIKTVTILFLTIQIFVSAQITDSIKTEVKILTDSTFLFQDSLAVNDSLLIPVKRDSIAPIYSSALSDKSFIISKYDLSHNDYKYTGDYLRLFPFNFIKDLGFTGQPNETFFYGVGNGAVNYLMDGVSVNDRFANSLNLNLIQSEDVDSIEIVPLPRGFLYGAYSNAVAVNFNTKDFITPQPYTRIRFYQGANRDMMLDGSFDAQLMKRLIGSFSITNRILDPTYDATDYSIWQGKVKLKYLLSNDVNIIATYNYNDYKAGYSGGVDVDSIAARGEDPNSVMYDFRAAPMLYPEGQIKTLTHLPRLRVLATPTSWLKTDASLFFMFSRYEKNTVERDYSENKTYGLNLRNDFDYSIFRFQLYVDYERRDMFSSRAFYNSTDSLPFYAFQDQQDTDLFSVSGVLSANVNNGTFIPSIFYKASSSKKKYLQPFAYNDDNNSQGVGIDLLVKIKSNLGFYVGTSALKPYNRSEFEYALIELGAKYQDEIVFADLKYFYNQYNYGLYTGGVFFDYIKFGYLNGLGLNLKFNLWKMQIESNSSFYPGDDNSELVGVPQFQTQTGLYYKDILFNNNLDLKTGFVFYYTGRNNVFTYENGLVEVPSSYKLDFILVGEIQKTAIIYFTWQNLLDNDYYLTPYYPMPGRSLRFGVAWEMFN